MRIWPGQALWVKRHLCLLGLRSELFVWTVTRFSAVLAGSFFTGQSSKNNEDVSLIRKADLENHNKDGGFWTVIDGKVYDIKDFQAQSQSLTGNSILGKAKQQF